jgi:hypothetical protein
MSALECGLLTRGGIGEENTLADAIPPFHYSFSLFSPFYVLLAPANFSAP